MPDPDASFKAALAVHEKALQLLADCHEDKEQPDEHLVRLALESVTLVEKNLGTAEKMALPVSERQKHVRRIIPDQR